ncbi:MAG: hypothetical protein IKA97_01530 [Clostridia bacterium]|nr:hypothetical protein [Clostridia bacterium]
MKKAFKFVFSKTIIALCVLLMVCIVAYIVASCIDIITSGNYDLLRIITSVAFIGVLALIIYTLFRSKYEIKKDGVYINVSISLYKVDLEKITEIRFDKTSAKLFLVYYENGKRLSHFVQIKSEEYVAFATAIKEYKPTVLYVEE